MWRSYPKVWVIRQFFIDWFEEVFVPSVKKYLKEKKVLLKALLVLDNAPRQSPGLKQTFNVVNSSINHFNEVLKYRQTQITLDHYFSKERCVDGKKT